MGFQMSVICIGQLAAAGFVVKFSWNGSSSWLHCRFKADQLSVLVNNAMMTAISNYGTEFWCWKEDRIRQGVRACLIQTEAFNLFYVLEFSSFFIRSCGCFCRSTQEIYHYSICISRCGTIFISFLVCLPYTALPFRACKTAGLLSQPA